MMLASSWQETTDVGPVELPWLWILIAAGFLAIIVYLVKRIGPGGPWASR